MALRPVVMPGANSGPNPTPAPSLFGKDSSPMPSGLTLPNTPNSSSTPSGLTIPRVSRQTTFPTPKQPDFATNVGAGVLQSGAGAAAGLFRLGVKIPNAISKIPGLGWLYTDPNKFGPEQALEKAATPQNTTQAVAKTATDIAQFFLPSGAEKAAAGKINEAIDTAKFAEKFGPEAGKVLENILKIAGQGAVGATSMGSVEAVQSGGDPQKTIDAAEAGGVFGVAGKALELFAPGMIKALMKSDFKLSPMQEAKAAKKAESAAQFLANNKILGSDSTKYNKLVSLNGALEQTLQSSLPEGTAGAGVPVKDIIDTINSKVESLKSSDPAIYNAARSDADEAIKLLQSQAKDGNISMGDTLAGKRSFGQKAFRTAKYQTKDPRVVAEGAYAVEQAYQGALESKMSSLDGAIDIPKNLRSLFGGKSQVSFQEFNKVYSDAITAKNLTFTAQYKNDSGLMGRLFGLWAGETIGQTVAPGLPGKILGGAAGEMLSVKGPGAIRNLTERGLSAAQSTASGIPKVTVPIFESMRKNNKQ